MTSTPLYAMIRAVLILLLMAILPTGALAEEPESTPAGYWEGAIELPGTRLDVQVNLRLAPDGQWQGDISIPLQNARNLPLGDFQLSGQKLSFKISGVPGEPTFNGTLTDNGQRLAGTFTQGGQEFPFALEKAADPATAARHSLSGLDEVIGDAMTTFHVPGLAIAVVKDTEVIYLKGFGRRDVENDLPVTPETLFAIGSSTKAFTTFVLGTLVDEGLLDWDQPVRTWIPWFQLSDPVITERITPRDLVTHRSGLPRHDLVWYNNFSASRQGLVEKMAYLEFNADLRERFQYNNLMFLTAGYLTEVVTEQSWEEAVRDRILIPLEMSRTNFSVLDSQADPDHALPYREEKDRLERIPFRPITTVGPAGSINSSVADMSHWLLVHLNQGRYGDRRVMGPSTLQDMHLAHMVTGEPPERPELTPPVYGLGWFRQSYRGHTVVHHGGNIDGFSAMVALFPQDGCGMVILTNLNGTPLRDLLVWHVADRLLGLEAKDWIGEAAAKRSKAKEIGEKAEKKKATRRKPGTRPAHAPGDYAGIYDHAGYGHLEIALDGDKLVATYNGIATPLEHWHYDTFNGLKAEDDVFEDMKYTFYTDEKGHIATLSVPFEATVSPIVFTRQPADKYYDPEFLIRFTGEYDMETTHITVGLRGDTLTLAVPGQPLVDLEPDLGDEFVIHQYSVVSVGFITDEAGNITALELYQPNGVFTAKKIVGNTQGE